MAAFGRGCCHVWKAAKSSYNISANVIYGVIPLFRMFESLYHLPNYYFRCYKSHPGLWYTFICILVAPEPMEDSHNGFQNAFQHIIPSFRTFRRSYGMIPLTPNPAIQIHSSIEKCLSLLPLITGGIYRRANWLVRVRLARSSLAPWLCWEVIVAPQLVFKMAVPPHTLFYLVIFVH